MEQSTPTTPRKLPWDWGVWLATILLLLGWLFSTPSGILGKSDAIGYAVCHRIDLRSFHLGDRQLPLCARCTGMYLGAIVAFVVQWRLGARRYAMPGMKLWPVFGLFVLAFGIDGLNSYLHLEMMQILLPNLPRLYEPGNLFRLFTGTGMGLTIGAALFPVFNQTIWANGENRPVIENFRSLGLVVGVAVLVDILVLTEIPWLLYVLGILSALGVLLILTMVYTLVWVMVLRSDNRYLNLFQLRLPLVAGFFMALLQIAFLDALRLMLTGTWAGFPLS